MKKVLFTLIMILSFSLFSCSGSLFSNAPGSSIGVSSFNAAITADAVTITWATDFASTHQIEYGTVSGTYTNTTAESTSPTLSHAVTLAGLNANTTYYYIVKNIAEGISASTSTEQSFTTNNGISVSGTTVTVTSSTAVIAWTSNVASFNQVQYGTTSGTYPNVSSVSSAAVTAHSVTLNGLTAGTRYYFRLKNTASGYLDAASDEFSFVTLSSSINVTNLSIITAMAGATISWNTSSSVDHYIEYGTASGSYGNTSSATSSPSTVHSVTLSSLNAGQTYYFRIHHVISAGNETVSDEITFSTISATSFMTGLSVSTTSSSAVLSWNTSSSATHLIKYGTISGTYSATTTQTSSSSSSHVVSLSSLALGTTYFVQVHNFSGAVEKISDEITFTTLGTSSDLSQVTVTAASTSAIVSWNTTAATTHYVEYGTVSGTYSLQTTLSSTPSTGHTVTVSGLTAGTNYFFRIRNFASNYENFGPELTFSTLNPIVVSGAAASTATITAETISWTTNIATTHCVLYGTSSGNLIYSTPMSGSASMSHSVTITGLTSNTNYFYQIQNLQASTGIYSLTSEASFQVSENRPTLAEKLRGIWVVGGLTGSALTTTVSEVDLYDPVTNQWNGNVGGGSTAVTTLPTPVSFPAAASINNKIYVFGGFGSDAAGTVKTLIQIYDIASGTWDSATYTLPTARGSFNATVTNGKIYMMGGATGNGTAAWAGSNTVWEFVDGVGINAKTAAGTARTDNLIYAYNDVLYSNSGRSAAPTVSVTTNSNSYSIAGQALSTALSNAAPLTARTGACGAIYVPSTGPAYMIVLGGFSTFAGTTGNFPVTGNSTSTAPTGVNSYVYLPYPFVTPSVWGSGLNALPAGLGYGSSVIKNGTLYWLGGTLSLLPASVAGKTFNYAQSSIPSGSWSIMAPMPRARYGHAAVVIQ